MKQIIAVIPAKSGSQRLPAKNMAEALGMPLLGYTIGYAKESRLVNKIYVSTDSGEIAEFAGKKGVSVIMRPAKLCGEAPIIDVYRHALLNMDERDIGYIAGLQPDHPDRTISLDEIIKYAQKNDLDDLISVDAGGAKNGSFRILKADALKEKQVSIKAGTLADNATNIHSIADLRMAEAALRFKERPLSIKIKNKFIAKDKPAFIIAEAACNHMCDMNRAKEMIDEAEAAGADAVKFQTYKAEKLVAKNAPTYWNYGTTKSQYDYYKNLDKFGIKEYADLFDYAKDKELAVFSSPFDIDSASMLNELGMSIFKIASCLIPDLKLIRHIARFQKPVILSVGGSEIDEIKEAVGAIYAEGNFSLILLACTLSYPCKYEDAHLLGIKTLTGLFPQAIIGYSDHTEPEKNMVIPSLAVAVGAKVIEKHFTLDRTMSGSGHSFSVDPKDLKNMIENIRIAEKALGEAGLGVREREQKTRENARMSIVAKNRIDKGQVISEANLTVLRPGTGILPKFIDKIVGKKAARDISDNEQIQWNDIE